MKKYYAEKATLGADDTTIIKFNTKKEREDFVKTVEHTNRIAAKEVCKEAAITLAEYNFYY